MTQVSLTLLGGFRAQFPSGMAVTLPTRKAQALLAYLALPPGRAHPRDKLAALLWGDVPQTRARGALRQALFALRRGLPTDPPALRLDGDTVALDQAAVLVDVTTFEGHAAGGTPDDLVRAVALYQGDLLAGLGVAEAAFEEWLAFERERLRELALETMARLLAHQRSAGAAEAAIRTALGLLALDPLQEPVHRTLMRLYAGLGRRGAALRQYQLCVDTLRRELSTAPEAATRRLYEEILRQPPVEAVDAPAASGGPAVEDLPRDTPLIGRGAELVRLRAAVDGALRGSGRVVAIVGEAGIGKSRLVAEVCAEASARGVRVLVGRAHEAEQVLAFGVWAEILRGARPGDDPVLLAALGAPWRAALASLLPEVAAPGRSSAEPTDYRRLFESVARVVEHLGGRQSLLVVIEDAHWADDMSVRLLAFLGRRLAALPVLVVVTAREEDLADAPALRRLLEDPAPDASVTVALGRLARDETLALVRALSRAAGDAEALATRGETVWIASEGNPFMVVESVRVLDASDGPPPSRALLPERVRTVIQRRLDRLGGAARELAMVAAVIGRDVDFALLHRAAGMDEASAASLVEELVRHRILHGVGERFDFTHDRIRETVYRGLLEPRRNLLHRAVGEAIEARHAGALEPHHLTLGLHYREAACWARAARYLRLAGLAAAGRGAHREAVTCFEAALAALERLPASAETRAEATDLRFDARNSLFPLGDDERLFQHLQAAERAADELGDRRRLAWASSYMSNYLWRSTDHARALEAAQRALAIATTISDRRLATVTLLRVGQACISIGDYRQAAAALRTSVASLDGPIVRERFGLAGLPAAFSRAFLAWALAELGEFPEAVAAAEESVRIAETIREPYSRAVADYVLGRSHLQKGDVTRAIAVLEAGWARSREADLPANADHLAGGLGYAYALAGRVHDGLPLLERAVQEAESVSRHFHSLSVVWLGDARRMAADLVTARRLGRDALRLASERHERGNQAYALRLLGDVESAGGPQEMETAGDHYRRALALAEELGMRPLVGHCHLGLGWLSRSLEGRATADEHLGAAASCFRELDMPGWLARLDLPAAGARA